MPTTARKQPLPSALRELQAALRIEPHLATATTTKQPPPPTQATLFRHYAPLSIIIATLCLPLYADLGKITPARACGTLALGVVMGLGALRIGIWIGARLLEEFCEMDLKKREGVRVRVKPNDRDVSRSKAEKEVELTSAGLMVGGIFG